MPLKHASDNVLSLATLDDATLTMFHSTVTQHRIAFATGCIAIPHAKTILTLTGLDLLSTCLLSDTKTLSDLSECGAGQEWSKTADAATKEIGGCIEDTDEEVSRVATLCPQALHLLHHLLCCSLTCCCLLAANFGQRFCHLDRYYTTSILQLLTPNATA